jgi:tRNA dimethylallyltransferase
MLGVLPTTDHRALVEKRTRSMFERGWIDEVRGLIDRGYSVKDPGIQATGYRAVMECVQQGSDPVDLIDSIVAETMQYAKRQMTWWKRDGRIVWVMGLWGPVRTFA